MSAREEAKKKGFSLKEDLILRVSKDEMEAWLEGNFPSPEEWKQIREKLKSLGLHGLLDPPEPTEGRLVVARGKPSTPGEDGRLEFLVDLSHGPRKIDKHRVNLREMNLVVSVRAGTPVVRRIPPRPGQPGFNVWGEVLNPPPVKDVEFNYGQGLKPDAKNEILVATRDGCLVDKEGKLLIEPIFTLDGDVDWESGNVHFCGEKLIITGSVRRGFQVEATGEVEIQGGIDEDAKVKIEGHLRVAGLVRGEGTVVEVQGDAFLGSVEYATVKVRGNLQINDYILQARIEVGQTFQALGERGLVAAGEVKVGKGAQVKVLGNDSFVPTLFKVGSPPEILEEIEKYRAELALLDENTDKLQKAVALGLKLKKEGKLSPEKAKILIKLQKLLGQKLREQMELQEKLREKEEALKAFGEHTLRVWEKVYPGVVIAIGQYEYPVRDEVSGPVEFYLEGKKVKTRPF